MKFYLSLNLFFWGLSTTFSQNCTNTFNFNEWSVEGSPNGVWNVVDSSNVINTFYDFPPTFFVSTENLINVLVQGTMSVETGQDNDFTGIVLGYKKPTQLAQNNTYNFYLFDWKAETEAFQGNRAKEGFRLSYYDGFITREEQGKYFWGTESKLVRWILEEKYGDELGWKNLQKYRFTLLYTTSRIRITIDDEVIFEREGCFEAGKFGFYCMSQTLTRFEDFTYQSFVDFVPLSKTVCEDEEIYFKAFDLDCSALPDFIKTMDWDFGDGHTSTEINPGHAYASAGEYAVTLIVSKTDGCADTLVKTVSIRPMPLVDLGNDTLIPACSSILLDAGNPGAEYSWSTSQNSQTIELIELNSDTTVWVTVNKKGCVAGDTVTVAVEKNTFELQLYFPNAFTPNDDGNNDVFSAVGPTDNVSLYQLTIFNRWGQQVFETHDPNAGWDGGNPLQMGVYVYKVVYRIEGNCIETKDFSETGFVVVVK